MITNSFLELYWLARSEKDILLPLVLFIENYYVGGECFDPEKQERQIDGKFYPQDRGILVINPYLGDTIASTIAHEWRHLWQFYNGWDEDVTHWDLESPLSYKEQIIQFFKSSKSEHDALLFEIAKAPCDINQKWYEWINNV